MKYDLAIVGGGPAGLACGIEAALRGLRAVVIERRAMPCDKACGEGLMPAGVRALAAMGVLPRISVRDRAPFRGIRYIQEDGSSAEGLLPDGGGLGIRRVALVDAMAKRAQEVGVEVRDRSEVRGHRRVALGYSLATTSGPIETSLLVAADGLASPLRRAEGLDIPSGGARRFGARRHYQTLPWTPFVEVHFSERAEAYVTPAGQERVGVAFLWEADRLAGPASFESLLGLFPALAERLVGLEPDSPVRGAGPLEREARARVADQFVLLGDAAGYVDAITGEGLTLAFSCARALGRILPDALSRGATARALSPYERAFQREFRRYAFFARALLSIARRPEMRRRVIHFLGRYPALFERVLAVVAS